MQLGQGIIPVDLIISPLLAQSTFSLWLPPYRTARITSVCSHSRVYTPKEGSKHCRGTDCLRGTSYLYCQNLKAIYQWHSFSWKGSKTTQELKTVKKIWISNRKQEKQAKKINLLLWKTFALSERSEEQVSSHSPKLPLNKLMIYKAAEIIVIISIQQ